MSSYSYASKLHIRGAYTREVHTRVGWRVLAVALLSPGIRHLAWKRYRGCSGEEGSGSQGDLRREDQEEDPLEEPGPGRSPPSPHSARQAWQKARPHILVQLTSFDKEKLSQTPRNPRPPWVSWAVVEAAAAKRLAPVSLAWAFRSPSHSCLFHLQVKTFQVRPLPKGRNVRDEDTASPSPAAGVARPQAESSSRWPAMECCSGCWSWRHA